MAALDSQLASVVDAYAGAGGELDNRTLYEAVGLSGEALRERTPVGRTGRRHNLRTRKVRWYQQTLRRMGLIEKVPGQRGNWRLTDEGRSQTGQAAPGVALVAFSTELGIAIWASWEDVFPKLDEPIHLAITSPPYPLRKPRAYGNPDAASYVDFVVAALEPIVRNLVPGGTICLNISNDIFEPGTPARSLYRERLVIALFDRLNLSKLDEVIWSNPSRPPAPVQWASKTRQQLNAGWEPVYVFTNDPLRARGDNRRVLLPHTERHARLIAAGGEQRAERHSDGAYAVRRGSYGNPTSGRIPRNVLTIGHRCSSQQKVKAAARRAGVLPHGAPMPLALADFFVRWLTAPGELVVDPFAGSLTTGEAAERNGRRWLCTERMGDYLTAAPARFA